MFGPAGGKWHAIVHGREKTFDPMVASYRSASALIGVKRSTTQGIAVEISRPVGRRSCR